jgi:hypothetical protein
MHPGVPPTVLGRQTLSASINFSDAKHQRMINDHLQEAEFPVLDNMSTLMNGDPESDAESWISMQAWLAAIAPAGSDSADCPPWEPRRQ